MLEVTIKSQLKHYVLDVSFQAQDELIVLFGPSGSGKTTLLHTISGLDTPDEGFISIHGRDVYRHNSTNVPPQKRNVGYVFQDYALFPHMTVEKIFIMV